jgi:hypothetical protein
MKKALKIIGITILCIILIPLITALFVSKDFNFETSVTINAPIDSVWTHTNSLAGLDSWSPWREMDPAMTTESGGLDGEIGAWQSWKSEVRDIGNGKQTIVNIEPPLILQTYLEFYTPYSSEADGFLKLAKVEEGTIATWGFNSKMPYPFNLMKLFTNPEVMKEPFDMGLKNLKALSEAMMVVEETDETPEETKM